MVQLEDKARENIDRLRTQAGWAMCNRSGGGPVTIDEVKARNYNLDFKNPHVVADNHGDPEELLAKLDEAEKQTVALRDQLKAILEEALLR